MKDRIIFRRIFDGFLDSLGIVEDSGKNFDLVPKNKTSAQKNVENISKKNDQQRSMSMNRLWEQVYKLLRENDDDYWAYPLDIYVDDDGSSLFTIVAQSGKLFSVPVSVSEEEVTLGDWTQVKQEFVPVTQSRITVKRQKDGTHRWFGIAATSVLNRVGQIDSTKLFDSFIVKAEKDGKYPRLDYYHYGSSNTEKWEFGTADYLARDGCCYIASGVFDEDHPLSKATIRAAEEDRLNEWGFSIEFYSWGKPETILLDPEVKVPVYEDGENTRISLVMEKDAASLFTRIGTFEEVERIMDKKVEETLKKLFGDDEDGFSAFVENSDSVNRTIEDENLIHRTKTSTNKETENKDENLDGEDINVNDEEDTDIILDEELVEVVTQKIVESSEFKTILQGLNEIKQAVGELIVERDNDKKTVVQLQKNIERLSAEDDEKKQEYLQDLPARRQKKVSFRPREAYNEDYDEFEEDLEEIANRTLNGIPVKY